MDTPNLQKLIKEQMFTVDGQTDWVSYELYIATLDECLATGGTVSVNYSKNGMEVQLAFQHIPEVSISI